MCASVVFEITFRKLKRINKTWRAAAVNAPPRFGAPVTPDRVEAAMATRSRRHTRGCHATPVPWPSDRPATHWPTDADDDRGNVMLGDHGALVSEDANMTQERLLDALTSSFDEHLPPSPPHKTHTQYLFTRFYAFWSIFRAVRAVRRGFFILYS